MAGFDPTTPVTFGLIAIAISVAAGAFGSALWLSSKLDKLKEDFSQRHDRLNSDILTKIGTVSNSIQSSLSEARLHADRLYSDNRKQIERLAAELNDHKVESARIYVSKDDAAREIGPLSRIEDLLRRIATNGSNGPTRTK